MTDERRTNQRVAAQGPCTIRDADGTERPFELIDLSESGARLRCSDPIGAMTRIHVAMNLPGPRIGQDADIQLETVGVIVWSHRTAAPADAPQGEDGAFYDTGVFFPELSEESAALLQAYVLSAA